jgi:hypothetical protein
MRILELSFCGFPNGGLRRSLRPTAHSAGRPASGLATLRDTKLNSQFRSGSLIACTAKGLTASNAPIVMVSFDE